MRIIVVGAGHVGATIIEALHEEHEIAVIDLDAARLQAVSQAFDVRTVEGNGASRGTLQEAGVRGADLVLASTARDEANLVTAMLVRRLSHAMTLVRTTDVEYLEAWREGDIDVDFMVSSEVETANAIASTLAVPAARETDMFADGAVQIVEFDVPADGAAAAITGRPLRAAGLPPESTVASIVRDGRTVEPTGGESILAGDRLIVIASPSAAQTWSRIMAPDGRDVDEVVIFGGGRVGAAVARALLERGIRVRLLEPDVARAQRCASDLPRARVFHATGLDPDFMRQERIGRAAAAVSAMRDDAKNLYAAILARRHGVPFTIGVVDNPVSAMVFEGGGVDVAVNPRTETAEEMIRFAHDPRTRQLAMLDDDRFEVIDIVVRAESRLADMRFRDMPRTGSVIGALIRDGVAVFPRGDEVLRAGDRAIVLVDSARASTVERAL